MEEDRILAILRSNPGRAYHLNELLKLTGGSSKKDKTTKRVLKSLARRGLIERRRGRTYSLSRAGQVLEGTVRITPKGIFVVSPTKDPKDQVPIVPDDAEGLRAGDQVRGELASMGRRGRLFFKVQEILRSERKREVGKFKQVGQAMFVEVELGKSSGLRPNLTNVPVPKGRTLDAQSGELVEVKVTYHSIEGRTTPLGEIVRVLGKPGERGAELMKLIIEHELDRPFPEPVVQEAEAFGDAPTEEDFAGRRDVRDLPLVTIDGETAKDFDDAVCAVKDKSGFLLYVAIADVSHYVRLGTPLDREAQTRGTSTYLTDRAIPMLPEALSNGLCSLKPNVDRLCMLAELHVAHNGHIDRAKFQRAVMRSKARLTYTQVAKALEGNPDEACAPLMGTLLLLSKISAKRFERRLRRGAIDLDLPEAQIKIENGEVKDAFKRPRNDAHRLIEELMLATNEAVASYFVERELPSIFRIHESPDPEKLESFAQLCAHLGVDVSLSDEPAPGEIAQLLERVETLESGRALHWLLLRSMKQARYDPQCEGHYGLASKAYLHFTSPIRRYPDLIVHRLLKRSLDGDSSAYTSGALHQIAVGSSELERKAMVAERSCMDLDRALLANRHIGERFKGTITGLQGFGLFVQIDSPFIEGMIPVFTLPEDYYETDDYGAMLYGVNSGRTYMLGDTLEVEVASVSISRRKVELRLAGEPPRTTRPKPRFKPRFKPRSSPNSRTNSKSNSKRGTLPRRGAKGSSKRTKRRRR